MHITRSDRAIWPAAALLAAALVFFWCASASASEWSRSFDELTDVRHVAVFRPFTTHQFSSYDRTGGNADWGHYLAVNGNRKVLADLKGAGEIVRIWSANPSGQLHITIDGESFSSGPFGGVFDGSVRPFAPPLATTSSGGSISYFPVPFRRSALVEAVDSADFYYQITYRLGGDAAGADAPSALDGLDAPDSAALAAAQRFWASPGAPARRAAGGDPVVAAGTPHTTRKQIRIAAGKSATIASLRGEGYIRELRFQLPASRVNALRQTRLVAHWDGAERSGVNVPLLDLFGSAFGLKSFQSIPIGRTRDGWWYVRFPMPFHKSASLALINESRSAIAVTADVSWVQGKVVSGALYYRTSFVTETTTAGKPHPILHAQGRGQFAGVSMTMQGVRGLGFLEGDELISVDGRSHTDFNGTGTEDYFNSGWYFREGPVSQPLHGCLVKDDAMSRISVYRFHLTDRIPFENRFVFDIEHGGVNDAPGASYSSLAHWYSASPGDTATPAVRASALGVPRKTVDYPAHAIALASLARTELSGGSANVLDWSAISETFTGGPVVVFRPKGIGSAVSYRFTMPFSDRAQITLWAAAGPGLGKVRVSVDQQTVGEVDLWSPEANQPQRVIVGDVPVEKGLRTLTLRSVGRNPGSAGLTIVASHIEVGSASPPVSDWAVLGPFDAPSAALQRAFIDEAGALDMKRSYDGLTWSGKQADDGILQFGDRQNCVWYAAVAIQSERDLDTEMLVGSDDGVKAWVNGALVHEVDRQRSIVPDSDRARVRLRQGPNRVLFKVNNLGGPASLAVRFRDPGGVLTFSVPSD